MLKRLLLGLKVVIPATYDLSRIYLTPTRHYTGTFTSDSASQVAPLSDSLLGTCLIR